MLTATTVQFHRVENILASEGPCADYDVRPRECIAVETVRAEIAEARSEARRVIAVIVAPLLFAGMWAVGLAIFM